jgi:diacylglycerol kinase
MMQGRWNSILNAFKGFNAALKEEPNMRIHFVASILVVACAFAFALSLHEWLWIIWCIALVFILELVNTAIEKWMDWLHPERRAEVGYIKDVMAAAVLVAAVASLLCGGLIFIPKIAVLFGL